MNRRWAGSIEGVHRGPRNNREPGVPLMTERVSSTRTRRTATRSPVVRGAALLCLSLLATSAGCDPTKPANEPTDETGITRTAGDGPVRLSLTVAPVSVQLSQRAEVVFEILADRDVTVTDTDYRRVLLDGDRGFEIGVVETQRKSAVPTEDGRLRWTFRYRLEFFVPGVHELPPAAATFVYLRQPSGGDTGQVTQEPQTVTTEPITITVVQPEGAGLSPEQLTEIRRLDPVELPRQWGPWIAGGLVAAVALVVLVLLIRRRIRNRPAEVVVVVPADVWARREIAALVTEDLVARGRVKDFYYRVSGIVRGYIERRFDVCAPEMTTEEFLASAPADGRIGPAIADELHPFMTACDLVKYARHTPSRETADAALKAAGDFVERTRRRSTPSIGAPPSPPSDEERAA